LQNLIIHAQESFILTENEIDRAVKLRKIGFGDMDALHLACAESGKVDVFLTTDDKLVRRATRLTKQLYVTVDNPLSWLVTKKGTRTG
jgi:predicted nucleic acid-binding protein